VNGNGMSTVDQAVLRSVSIKFLFADPGVSWCDGMSFLKVHLAKNCYSW
jgi:hypothetical protein